MPEMKTKRPATPNRGAADQRTIVNAHIDREIDRMNLELQLAVMDKLFAVAHNLQSRIEAFQSIRKFNSTTDDRASKKVGGLGRK